MTDSDVVVEDAHMIHVQSHLVFHVQDVDLVQAALVDYLETGLVSLVNDPLL